jgi:predicted phage terminase large subunit-like protein
MSKSKKTLNKKNYVKDLSLIDPAIGKLLVNGEELDITGLSSELRAKLRDALTKSLTVKASEDFYTYVELMAPEVIPEGFVNGRHIKIICNDLQSIEKSIVDAFEGHRARQKEKLFKTPSASSQKTLKAKRSQYFLPPGGMKSKLISILFVAWFLGRHPQWPVLQLGHSTKFCIDNFGRQVLDLLFNEKHMLIFPDPACRVKTSARSAQSFGLEGGGRYYTTGAGSKIAGRRAALLISDDVISEQEAYSNSVRTKINEWYVPGARSRLLPYGAEIVVNTRWHMEDLSGYLVKKDSNSKNPWNIIEFPAILDKKSSKLLGLPEGESFWPELWPVDIFEETKKTMLASKFNSMYLQKPIPDEGNIIKEEMWQEWPDEEPPYMEFVLASMDTAFSTSQQADYSAYTVWGLYFSRETGRNGFSYIAANLFLLGAEKGRWTFSELCEKVEFIQETWEPDYFLIEKKASGQSLIQELRLKKYPIIEYMPDKDKISRANACVTTFLSGRIWYPTEQGWAKDVIAEVCQFPAAPHDDLADTVWQAIIWMRAQTFVPNEGEIGYEDQLEDDDTPRNKRPLTYWGAVAG